MKTDHFILFILTVSSYFLYRVYAPFLQDIAIAILLMLATLSIAKFFEKFLKKRWRISALMSLFLGLIFFLPLLYLINAAVIAVSHFDPSAIAQQIKDLSLFLQNATIPDSIANGFDLDTSSIKESIATIFSDENIKSVLKQGGAIIGSVAAHSAVFIKDMLLILIFYFFTHLYGEDLGHFIKRILPLDSGQTQILFNELSNSMGVVFFSILATAMFEGALFAVIVAFFGMDALLLGILYGFASLVPVVGGALMWVPVSIYLWNTQGASAAITVAIYSIVVISFIADTLIKPVIIKEIDQKLLKETNAINEILVFFSILAGLSTFGFWGMIIGPAVTTIFIAILKLYDQLQENEKQYI